METEGEADELAATAAMAVPPPRTATAQTAMMPAAARPETRGMVSLVRKGNPFPRAMMITKEPYYSRGQLRSRPEHPDGTPAPALLRAQDGGGRDDVAVPLEGTVVNAALVHPVVGLHPVAGAAERHQVPERGEPAVGPGMHVVELEAGRVAA